MPAQSPEEPTSHADAGDGVVLTPREASTGAKGPGARRIMWLLVASLILVCIALLGAFALSSHGLSSQATGSQKSRDVSSFAAPQPSPRQDPPTPTVKNGGQSPADPNKQ